MRVTAKATIEGKEVEFEVDIAEDTIKAISGISKKRNGIGIGNYSDIHYTIGYDGSLRKITDDFMLCDADKACNVYYEEDVAKSISESEILYRKIRKFSADNQVTPIDPTHHYIIVYDYWTDKLIAEECYQYRCFGGIAFDTKENCEEAIKVFDKQLKAYFKGNK